MGADFALYAAGRLDWNKFIDACAKAFVVKIQKEIYAEMINVADQLPAQFKGTGALTKSIKDSFDEVVDNVAIANETSVIIMGTKTALRKLTNLADISWVSEGQKEEMASMGRLGSYEGITLVEIPQRFALNDITQKLMTNDKLFIMPQVDNKFIKMVTSGETEINQITDKGELNGRMDDTIKYEVQRAYGVGVQIGRYFGVWSLA